MADGMTESAAPVIVPPPVTPGDEVRFVSPGSTPDRDNIAKRVAILEGWGLKVSFGENAFAEHAYMAGTDEQRLADINAAYRDPNVRAIVATRGGAGSYRIAPHLDFDAVRADPKVLTGFSDITCLHAMLWRQCRIAGVHGKLMGDADDQIYPENEAAFRAALMTDAGMELSSDPTEITADLTTAGSAEGVLLGGHLKLIAAMAGWGLPSFRDAVVLLEAVHMSLEDVDRTLLFLTKGGHLDGARGFAIAQFTGFESHESFTVMDLLREYLAPLGVPILGGLALGHGTNPRSVFLGTRSELDADARRLSVYREPAA